MAARAQHGPCVAAECRKRPRVAGLVYSRFAGLAGGAGQRAALGLVSQVSHVVPVHQVVAGFRVHDGLLRWSGSSCCRLIQIVTRPTYEPLISRIQNPFGNAKG